MKRPHTPTPAHQARAINVLPRRRRCLCVEPAWKPKIVVSCARLLSLNTVILLFQRVTWCNVCACVCLCVQLSRLFSVVWNVAALEVRLDSTTFLSAIAYCTQLLDLNYSQNATVWKGKYGCGYSCDECGSWECAQCTLHVDTQHHTAQNRRYSHEFHTFSSIVKTAESVWLFIDIG